LIYAVDGLEGKKADSPEDEPPFSSLKFIGFVRENRDDGSKKAFSFQIWFTVPLAQGKNSRPFHHPCWTGGRPVGHDLCSFLDPTQLGAKFQSCEHSCGDELP
jgi:hypothetical protein